MPANLTPDYMAAEARFKAAREPRERIEALEEMLRVIPKHKGTDHLRGNLRKRLSQLREEVRSAPKGGGRRADPGYVPSQGAGQVLLLGRANVGKSALLAAMSNAEPAVAEYPYTTQKPLPGMAFHQDVPIQLVDTPAADPSLFQAWMNPALRNADLAVAVLDPSMPGVLGAIDTMAELAGRGRVSLVPAWWAVEEAAPAGEVEEDLTGRELDDADLLARLDPGKVELPMLVAVNKVDLPDQHDELEVLRELMGDDWPILPVSANTGEGLQQLAEALFRALRVIRVYAKPPGKPASMKEPIVLPIGATVRDMARTIHRDIERQFRFARIWCDRYHDGQRIPREQVLEDGDLVEIHV